FVLEATGLDSSDSPLVRVRSVFVLLLASDFVFFRNVLARVAHVIVVVLVPKSVVNHGIHQGAVTETISRSGLGQKVRTVAHRLHATSDNDLGIPSLYCLRCQPYRL